MEQRNTLLPAHSVPPTTSTAHVPFEGKPPLQVSMVASTSLPPSATFSLITFFPPHNFLLFMGSVAPWYYCPMAFAALKVSGIQKRVNVEGLRLLCVGRPACKVEPWVLGGVLGRVLQINRTKWMCVLAYGKESACVSMEVSTCKIFSVDWQVGDPGELIKSLKVVCLTISFGWEASLFVLLRPSAN